MYLPSSVLLAMHDSDVAGSLPMFSPVTCDHNAPLFQVAVSSDDIILSSASGILCLILGGCRSDSDWDSRTISRRGANDTR